MLKHKFGFAEHQEKATYDLGYELTLTIRNDDAVIDQTAGIADARSKIDYIHWYVPQNTLPIQQQSILSKQIVSETPTKLRYVERSVFIKK